MTKEIIPIERITQAVQWIRGEKALLDFDLAKSQQSRATQCQEVST
jgi:hypothetical protein